MVKPLGASVAHQRHGLIEPKVLGLRSPDVAPGRAGGHWSAVQVWHRHDVLDDVVAVHRGSWNWLQGVLPDGQYLMTTRPSILPCFISSKTALISLRFLVDTVG